jgi:hypothetical protein
MHEQAAPPVALLSNDNVHQSHALRWCAPLAHNATSLDSAPLLQVTWTTMAVAASALAFVCLGFLACSSSTNSNSATSEITGGADAAGASSVTNTSNGGSSVRETGVTPVTGGAASTGGTSQTEGTAANTGGTKAADSTPSATGGSNQGATAVTTGGSKPISGGSSAIGGTGNTTGGTKTTTISTAAIGGATTTGGNASSEPSAQDLLNKVTACTASATVAANGFGLDSGAGSISMYLCQGAVFWKADMDVDCDGIQTPPCDTDIHGQPQTSIVDDAPNGDVDPTLVPYFVIPLGEPETTWYKSVGVELGQVGAVIYKGSVRYGIFADEAGGAFIGEASYAMCQLFLGKPTAGKDPCDPNEGGIDPADVTYVTFTGATNRATGADIYSHDTHTSMGIIAARAWIAQ